MLTPGRPAPLPKHTSEQRYSPEMQEKLIAKFDAENPREDTVPKEPVPRYELSHDAGNIPSDLPRFTLKFHAPNPSAAKQIAHRFANKLDVSLCFYDRVTNHVFAFGPLRADEE